MKTGVVVAADRVCDVLRQHMLVDGFGLVIDLDASQGCTLVDARTGRQYLDMFTFFSSAPLGLNHPALADDPDFLHLLGRRALHKPSHPDVYTVDYARFVKTFADVLGDPAMPWLFFIDGGALAVENALKAAFDWKSHRIEESAHSHRAPLAALHLSGAFHGRSGYTMSMTSTDPVKTALFPQFEWPRIPTPVARFPLGRHLDAVIADEKEALVRAREHFESDRWTIACFIAEPIQGEGGDRHMRPEFLHGMARLCREYDALFALDEVQTGCGITGSMWAYQQLGLEPDLVAFGKKTQVCGVMAGRRLDEIDDHVFRVSSRVSSTWGGNLADMVRATRIFEVIAAESLIESAAKRGQQLLTGLETLAACSDGFLTNARGRGLMCAFDLPDGTARDLLLHRLLVNQHVIVLPCGERSIRFRPPLTITTADVDSALERLDRALSQ
jgi:L-lysine 6-transaminase